MSFVQTFRDKESHQREGRYGRDGCDGGGDAEGKGRRDHRGIQAFSNDLMVLCLFLKNPPCVRYCLLRSVMLHNTWRKEAKAMSKYSTGEVAKLCSVTVRTVQYYDTRGILIPSELSEGGRWLYSEDDLKRMKIICFLREMDLPIGAIAQILKEEHPEKVISLLIEQQEKALSDEIIDKEEKLLKLRELKTD